MNMHIIVAYNYGRMQQLNCKFTNNQVQDKKTKYLYLIVSWYFMK